MNNIDEIKRIISGFIKKETSEITNETVVRISVMWRRMYSELEKHGFKVSNPSKIKTFGELLNALAFHEKNEDHAKNETTSDEENKRFILGSSKFLYILILILIIGADTLSWILHFLILVIAALPVSWGVIFLYKFMNPLILIVLAPLIYLGWLFSVLIISNLEMFMWRPLFKKPAYMYIDEDIKSALVFRLIMHSYNRRALLMSLPLTNLFITSPVLILWLKKFIIQAYTPSKIPFSASINSIFCWPLDADITHIADNVIIGYENNIIAHAVNIEKDGRAVYMSAPIYIESGVTIGACSIIGMGVKIGRDALVIIGSNVIPKTQIGDGEIWGGNPAFLISKK
ncbi:MAG: hypothetical protein HQK78_18690 [Desulfobacterales bacterium]|nr:hypothetical protein [Desulfobacterales bacterium]